MTIVRQMPELLLRGSLANVTMANLTDAEQNHVSGVVARIVSHPDMARHRSRFVKELGSTIGADYNDDRSAAEEEFQIAVWRAAVNLLYHCKYTFKCNACGSSSYKTKAGRLAPIDRRKVKCPNCHNVRVTHAGDTNLTLDSYVNHEEFQATYADFTNQDAPRCESPIQYISGASSYDDSQKFSILSDDTQLVKFFGEFVWNYFRQTLKENDRVEHCKTPQRIVGPADLIIVQEIISLCSHMKLDFNYCNKTQPEHGAYHITIMGLQTPPEFTAEFAMLYDKGLSCGVIIECDDSVIKVHVNPDAPDIEAWIIKPEHVLVLNGYSSDSNDDDGKSFTISQVSYKTIGKERMPQQNQIELIDTTDVINVIRGSLPDGECKQVFDIWAGHGQAYIDFSNAFGDGRACINHIARHLKITTRAVNIYKDTIKVNMLAHGLIPQ